MRESTVLMMVKVCFGDKNHIGNVMRISVSVNGKFVSIS